MTLVEPVAFCVCHGQRVCKLPEEKFDFLGYTFGRCYSPKTGRSYTGTVPSKKKSHFMLRASN
jgi:RNA-directed DNA polymerase